MLHIRKHVFIWILGLGLALGAEACMPNGFLDSKNTGTAQSLTTGPTTQASDRPTDTGAGVPGYLVNCSEMSATGELVQVGCHVSSNNGTRIRVPADAWTRYDIKLAANANPSIKVTKSISSGVDAWDVAFSFTGAAQADLKAAAKSSTYSYNYVDENGKAVKAQTSTPVMNTKPATSQNSQSCSGGVVIEGVCIVSVPMSCTNYCDEAAMSVHPWVTERYGSASPANKQACADLYAKFPDQAQASQTANIPGVGSVLPLPPVITEVLTDRGLGCYRLSSGQALFDSSPTNPDSEPFLGYTRICACQP